MDTNRQLLFLRERIEEIGSALFYNLSDSVLKLPTSVVTTLKVDDYGYVWFFVQKPKQHLAEFEQEFPVKMDFYKKGKEYFLQVVGCGYVVSDPEEINSLLTLPEEAKQMANKGTALVKVKIQKAEFYETATSSRTHWWQTAISTVTTWFRTNPYRHGTTYFPAS